MTSAPTARRFSSPLVAVIAGLVCAQAACSLTSLDYLKNGERRDGALGDTGTSSPDMSALLDATHWDSVDLGASQTRDGHNLDGQILDGLLIDGPGDTYNSQGMDASTPDTRLVDDAGPDASGLDAPAKLDSTNPGALDAYSGADAASGGTTGTADAVTSQGGAGADGNTATGGQGGAGTGGSTSTTSGGTGGTSLIDGGEDEDTATGGQGGDGSGGSTDTGGTGGTSLIDGGAGGDTAAGGQGGNGTGGSTGTASGGAGGTSPMDGGAGGDTATGGQGEVGADASTDTPTCSGVLHAGICWYLGPQGSSCQQVCTNHGAPAPDAASHVGTAAQGGSNAECKVLLGLLGISGTPSNGTRTDGRGLGCHLYSTTPWWLTSPNFSASSSEASSRLVCGCTM